LATPLIRFDYNLDDLLAWYAAEKARCQKGKSDHTYNNLSESQRMALVERIIRKAGRGEFETNDHKILISLAEMENNFPVSAAAYNARLTLHSLYQGWAKDDAELAELLPKMRELHDQAENIYQNAVVPLMLISTYIEVEKIMANEGQILTSNLAEFFQDENTVAIETINKFQTQSLPEFRLSLEDAFMQACHALIETNESHPEDIDRLAGMTDKLMEMYGESMANIPQALDRCLR